MKTYSTTIASTIKGVPKSNPFTKVYFKAYTEAEDVTEAKAKFEVYCEHMLKEFQDSWIKMEFNKISQEVLTVIVT